jgi:hypothetical protein
MGGSLDQQEVRGVCWKHVRSHVVELMWSCVWINQFTPQSSIMKEGKQTICLQAFDTELGNHSECDPVMAAKPLGPKLIISLISDLLDCSALVISDHVTTLQDYSFSYAAPYTPHVQLLFAPHLITLFPFSPQCLLHHHRITLVPLLVQGRDDIL